MTTERLNKVAEDIQREGSNSKVFWTLKKRIEGRTSEKRVARRDEKWKKT